MSIRFCNVILIDCVMGWLWFGANPCSAKYSKWFWYIRCCFDLVRWALVARKIGINHSYNSNMLTVISSTYHLGDMHLSLKITATRLLWFWATSACLPGNRCLSYKITVMILLLFWVTSACLPGDKCLSHEIKQSCFCDF